MSGSSSTTMMRFGTMYLPLLSIGRLLHGSRRLLGELDRERRADPALADDGDRSPVGFDDLVRDVEPEPEPAVRSARDGLFVALEDPLRVFGRYPDSRVAHR